MLPIAIRISVVLTVLAASSAAAAAPARGWVGGRLLFTQEGEPATLAAAEAAAGAEVVLELRSGRDVVTARLDEDGYFVAEGAPGTYRIEYLVLGPRAEFIAPHDLTLQAGKLTCAGTIAIEVNPLASLGSNVATPVEVRDTCAEAWPHLRQLAGSPEDAPEGVIDDAPEAVRLAYPGPTDDQDGRTVREILVGLRAEAALGSHLALRGVYLLPLRNRLTIFAEAGLVYDDDLAATGVTAYELGGGAGYRLFGPVDAMLLGGLRLPTTSDNSAEPLLGATVRVTGVILGLGLRFEVLPHQAAFFTIDVAPLGVLGALL